MKTNKFGLGILIIIVFLLFNPSAFIRAESHIQNITLQREGDYTNITILAEAPFEFDHFIEEKKEGKPYRIVIDCLNAVHSLPQNNFSQLPSEMIKAIRTSQYQTTPDKICRIVLDLKSPVVYKVVDKGDNKVAKLALATPEESVYPLWSAVQIKKTEKLSGSAETKPAEKVSPEKKVLKSSTAKEKDIEKSKKELTASPVKEKQVQLAQKPKTTTTQKVKSPEKPASQVKEEVKKSTAKKEQPTVTVSKKPEVAKADTLRKEPPAKVAGKIMEEVPKRKVLVYHSGERKDPFSPLTGKKSFALGTLPLPSIEELKLVGILEDNNGFKALLENELGYGYIMQPGDRIRNGSVVSIDKERIIFQVYEYGFTKNIALELFTPNQEER